MKLVPKWWSRMSERKQAGIRFFLVALVLLFTVTLTISVTSYVFTWKQDQSLLTAPAGTEAANAAATSGEQSKYLFIVISYSCHFERNRILVISSEVEKSLH